MEHMRSVSIVIFLRLDRAMGALDDDGPFDCDEKPDEKQDARDDGPSRFDNG